jgi:broad-specificity NMP kinase
MTRAARRLPFSLFQWLICVLKSKRMPSYDLKLLNDKEFECLGADLLSKELGKRVETFKPGKDKGIDGRFFIAPDTQAIVQIKHWERSGWSALIRHLQNSELSKVQTLAPARYYLVTSVELSRENKKKIYDIFNPFIKSEADIFGNEDIQQLLSQHSEIEKKYYKLWLSSIKILDTIFNASILGRSKERLESIREALPKYVFTSDYTSAVKKLNDRRVVIITGEPGIGKTTLADQLCYSFTANGYRLFVIENDLTEAEAVIREDEMQLFYYDDFLGSNYLEALSRNEDSHIVGFISRVSRSKNKLFILTSRSTILNRANVLTEKFQNAKLKENEFTVQITNISKLDKAKILYNHIWISNLTEEHKEVLHDKVNYKPIINHPNFNPRLISIITDLDRLRETPIAHYSKFIKETLDKPTEIWAGAFTRQLDTDSRWLTCAVYFSGGDTPENDIKATFFRLNRPSQSVATQEETIRFESALKLATGAFIKRTLNYQHVAQLSLFSPAIGDYLLATFSSDVAYISALLTSLKSTRALKHTTRLFRSNQISLATFTSIIEIVLANHQIEETPSNYDVALVSIATLTPIPNTTITPYVVACGNQLLLNGDLTDYEPDDFINVFLYILETEDRDRKLEDIGDAISVALNESDFSKEDFKPLTTLIHSLQEHKYSKAEDLYDQCKELIIDFWNDNIEDEIQSSSALEDYLNGTADSEDAMETAIDFTMELLNDYDISFDYIEAQQIAENIDIDSILEDQYEDPDDIPEHQTPTLHEEKAPQTHTPSEDDHIDDLFKR